MTKRTPNQTTAYPAGYFTELIREHNWPPMFEPRYTHDDTEWKRKLAGQAAREVAAREGKGWNTGTILMPNTPKWLPPTMMKAGA